MPPISYLSFTILATLVAVILLVRRHRWRNRLRGFKLPPGPRGWPIIGNLLDLPTEQAWVVYRDWSRTYGMVYSQCFAHRAFGTHEYRIGNMMFLQAFATPMLVISSPDICRDLMEKRSAIYSDKARFAIDELYVASRFRLGLCTKVCRPYL